MNKWVLPHIREEVVAIEKSKQEKQAEQAQYKLLNKSINYVILDAALWDTDINTAFDLCPVYTSLFATRGAERELDDVAPYLFPYLENTDFSKWLKSKEERLRVLYISSDETMEGLRKHFRRFLRVKTEEGKWLFFRFYDPNVAEVILPYLNEEQQYYFYYKINYILFYHRFAKKIDRLFPSPEIAGKIQESSLKSYPILIFSKSQLESISLAQEEEYINRVMFQLHKDKPQYVNIIADVDKTSECIRKQMEKGRSFGFTSEKDCYEYICLMVDYPELENNLEAEQISATLNNQKYSNSKKISILRNQQIQK